MKSLALALAAGAATLVVALPHDAAAQSARNAKPDAPTQRTSLTPAQRDARAALLAKRLGELDPSRPATPALPRATPSAFARLGAPLPLAGPAPAASPSALSDALRPSRASGHVDARAGGLRGEDLRALPAGESAARQLAATHLDALRDPITELDVTAASVDAFGTRHVRLRQVHHGVPVYGGEVVLHQPLTGLATATGRLGLTPKLPAAPPTLSPAEALAEVGALSARPNEPSSNSPLAERLLAGLHDSAELHYVRHAGRYRLSYVTETSPTLGEHFVSFVDAHTGEVYDRYSERCTMHGGLAAAGAPDAAPPRTATATDLNGATRTLQVFESGGNHYLIDGTRRSFTTDGAVPGGERGALVTANAQGTSPQTNDFRAVYSSSAANRWTDAAEVSAHYNTEVSYEYFERTFGRNSLDGQGGTVTAFVNTVDENGAQMDNAFYVNGLMFYGNGDRIASNWAGSLDVGGHEMSHGVVDFSANLEYRDESGALNEHFADVFAVMIDRDDWLLGDEIVDRNFFPTGALRSFADPRNGGTTPNDPGYQPDHYRDRYLGAQDNGGVHINSGIPNHAAYLTAQAIGRAKTEQIWYSALTNYLTRTSQFIDFRAAIQQATEQAYGRGAEYSAVVAALDAVGIPGTGGGGNGGGGGGTTQQTNPGTELIAVSDEAEDLVRLVGLDGATVIADITPSAYPASRVSISDDGATAVLATRDGDLNLISIDYATNTVSDDVIDGDIDGDGNGDIRNVALSRDGTRVALLTDDFDATLYVLDLVAQTSNAFTLYSPGSNGERLFTVEYADAMEWDYSGSYVVFDMLNRVGGGQQGPERSNWEIAVLKAYEGASYSDGPIQKLFGNLSPGVSIGNPTIAKNSENVLAYDYFDEDGTYETRAVDILTGDGGTLWRNDRLGWPTFTASDRYVLFDARDNTGAQVVAFVELGADKVSNPTGNASVFQADARKAWAFANGSRDLVSAAADLRAGADWTVGPNPAQGRTRVFRREGAQLPGGPIELSDVSGRLARRFPAASTELDLSGLAPGKYFVTWGAHTHTLMVLAR